jgi:hypothetical protein
LLDNYYDMLFKSVGNKNQPFDLSKQNFEMKDYNFKDETEKGIMFLKCMEYFGEAIWGLINVVDPPNTNEALKNIKNIRNLTDECTINIPICISQILK